MGQGPRSRCTVQKKNGQVQKTCTGPKKGAQVKKTCVPKMVASPMQGMSILKGEDNIFMYLQLLGISGPPKWLFKSIDEAAVPQKTFGVSESRMKVYTAR